jgi:hypothetical protein
MTARIRAAVYVLAAAVGTVALIYGWATNDQVDAWLRVVDSFLNLLAIVAPLLALKHLTPDAPKVIEGEVADDTEGMAG